VRRIGVLAALLLGGCAALHGPPKAAVAPPPPPVRVACVDAGEIPAEPPMVGTKFNGDAKHDLQVLAPNAVALRQWGQELRTLLEKCAPPPIKPVRVEAGASADR
jgi:hypothetical protein